jgi:inosose dehydratase
MPVFSRRSFVQATAAAAAVRFLDERRAHAAANEPKGNTCTLGISTYATKGMPLDKSIELISAASFDSIEIATQPGYEGEPGKLSADNRRHLRTLLERCGLKLTSLMEHLTPSVDDAAHSADTQRLQRVFQLAHDLCPQAPPLVQTVLGSGRWEEKKTLFRDRLADWLAAARSSGVTLCIKPHRGGAMSQPGEAIWLIEQLGNSPRLRMVYDYSHYAFREMPLEETVRVALPYTAHIAVKDAVQQGDRVVFQLPGASGTFDHARLIRLFAEGAYQGDFCCEVSGMVSNQPGYDPVAAIKTCYKNMAAAFEKAAVPRSRGGDKK